MARPTVGTFAEILYARLEPLAYDDSDANQWALLQYCETLGRQYDTLHEVLGADPAWSTLFDPDTCPEDFLPYLGQYVGVRIPVGTSEATARELVANPAGFQRGTPASLIAAVQRTLTGSKIVGLTERSGGAYSFIIHTLPAETPDTAATNAAILSQKPAGLQYSLVVSEGDTWAEVSSTWDGAGTVTWGDASTPGIPA